MTGQARRDDGPELHPRVHHHGSRPRQRHVEVGLRRALSIGVDDGHQIEKRLWSQSPGRRRCGRPRPGVRMGPLPAAGSPSARWWGPGGRLAGFRRRCHGGHRLGRQRQGRAAARGSRCDSVAPHHRRRGRGAVAAVDDHNGRDHREHEDDAGDYRDRTPTLIDGRSQVIAVGVDVVDGVISG